ncbi:MAG TPA: ClcB-like voltage-gated chloride channel protein [Verrucomicrobia bacterium]|nr:ClcB-like voltage-gated chloride channel protein [Verrucomicrobiota bacterium]HOP96089.1 ClcB-like voltage-gated chloride channel protein [Verrucomicrobiota bacterium]
MPQHYVKAVLASSVAFIPGIRHIVAVPPFANRTSIGTLQRFLRRHWHRLLRIREKIRFSEEAFHLVLAGGVGVLGGLVNLCAYYATESVKMLFFQRPGDPVEIAEMMQPLERIFIPALGGLFAGLILYWGLRLVGPQGSSNLLEVVVAGDGKLPFRTALVKFCSSMVTIGTGGSIGREGGVTQLSATLASKWGQIAKWPPYRLRLLVGCGAASGIAAAYNAPIAGSVFASLIVLGNFSMNLFAPLVFASVVATMVSRSFFGIQAWYSVPPFDFTHVLQLPWFVLLGVLAGAMGAAFLRMLQKSEDLFKKLRAPIYVRLMLGGLLVGLIAIQFPGVWGNGYAVTNRILQDPSQLLEEPFTDERHLLLVLIALLLAKLVATLATVGSGAVGGVFTPTLFLGASLGGAFGVALHRLEFAAELPVPAFALVGMGSMLSATTRSPLLAMIMVFEISLDYSLMPPLMLGCVVSILVAGRFVSDSVYTEPLRRKGLTVRQESTAPGAATERTVGDIMKAPVPPVRENAPLSEVADRFLRSANNFLPVVDARQQLVGVVALHDLKEYLNTGAELQAVIAYDVMRPPPPCVTPNQRLLDILPVVLASEQRNIPVVNTLKENRLIGSIARSEVLNLFSEAIAARSGSEE